jgi:hypothetical protein
MTNPPNLTHEQLCELFPAERSRLKDGIFELGLVLGGTGSAGAYTAGVLDYLLEALDAWQRAKEDRDAGAPPHEVVISTVAGASGGAVNGAILLRAAPWQFPHGPDDGNPFYAFWRGGASDLKNLLEPGPADGISGLSSLLNSGPIDAQASKTIEFKGQRLGTGDSPRHRAFLADPLRMFITVGNLSGIPYTIQLAGETGLSHVLCAHGDYMRFALRVENGVANAPESRPDEVRLTPTWPPDANWMRLRDAAVATGAFPIVLLSRRLMRLLAMAGYRVATIPGEKGQRAIVQLVPNWDALSTDEPDPQQSTFLNVDGGVFNNEPLELVRTALSGFNARNARTALQADRAVVMIDPLSDPETLQRPDAGNLPSVTASTITSLISQARFKPQDVALAYAENVYSRFLIAPVGPGPYNQRTVGQGAIASGALGGYSGFVDPSFRSYDFKLGRYNAHRFLAEHLALPVTQVSDHARFKELNNPIFHGWTSDQKELYAFTNQQDPTDTKTYLPIIPLMPRLRANAPKLDPWPQLSAAPDWLHDAVQARLQSVYELAKSQLLPDTWWKRIPADLYLSFGWRLFLRGALRDAVVAAIRNGLTEQGLLARQPDVRTNKEWAAAIR